MRVPVYCSNEYSVDEFGVVYSKSGTPLKPSVNPSGYKIVQLMINKKRVGKAVHTLVARAFVPGYSYELQVNHKDGNKLNNYASNLEWVTQQENLEHSRNILGNVFIGKENAKAKAVFGYSVKTGELQYKFESVADAARYFANGNLNSVRGIQNVISQVANHKPNKRSYKGCTWEYKQRC